MSEPNLQFSRYASQSVGKKPVGHGSVEHGRCDPAMRPAHIPLDRRIEFEFSYDRIVGSSHEVQAQPTGMIRAAHHAVWMQPRAKTHVRSCFCVIRNHFY